MTTRDEIAALVNGQTDLSAEQSAALADRILALLPPREPTPAMVEAIGGDTSRRRLGMATQACPRSLGRGICRWGGEVMDNYWFGFVVGGLCGFMAGVWVAGIICMHIADKHAQRWRP